MSEKLQIGRLLDDGQTVQCSALALSEGDFVDVGVTFDVALARAPNGHRRVRIFLCMEHVLQLLPHRRLVDSQILPETNALPRGVPVAARAGGTTQIYRSGLSFGEQSRSAKRDRDTDEIMI